MQHQLQSMRVEILLVQFKQNLAAFLVGLHKVNHGGLLSVLLSIQIKIIVELLDLLEQLVVEEVVVVGVLDLQVLCLFIFY